MLSSPPRSLARPIRLSTAQRRSFEATFPAISSGRSLSDRPSVQSRRTSRGNLERVERHLDPFFLADRLQDHVSIRGPLGLLRRQRAGFHERLDIGLVAGDLPDLPLADHVGARVADMGQHGAPVTEDRRGQRRRHSLQVGFRPGFLPDPLVDVLDGGLEERFPRAGLRQRLDLLREDIQREPARDLAGAPPADAVGHREAACPCARPRGFPQRLPGSHARLSGPPARDRPRCWDAASPVGLAECRDPHRSPARVSGVSGRRSGRSRWAAR